MGQTIGIQKPSNPLKKVPESAAWNPESKAVLDSLILGNYSIIKLLFPRYTVSHIAEEAGP